MTTCNLCDKLVLEAGVITLDNCWAHAEDDERSSVIRLLRRLETDPNKPELSPVALSEFDFSTDAYRNLNFGPGSLSGAQFKDALLTDISFNGTDLSGADFRGAHLDNVIFRGVDAQRLDLSRARLTRCRFLNGNDAHACNLRQASFRRATLIVVEFDGKTLLEEATFGAASLAKVTFRRCAASNADLQNLRCDGVRFEGGTFERAFFNDSVFVCSEDPLFSEVQLEGSDFRRISIGVEQTSAERQMEAGEIPAFVNCNLPNCNFDSAQLDNCLFEGRDGTTCNFENAGLTDSTFRAINLTAAVFAGAYLKGTRFSDLVLDAARFETAILSGTEFLNVHSAASVFTAARLVEGCTLRNCEFPNATFSQTVFKGVELLGATNFGDASLTGASFEDCAFEKTTFWDANLKGSTFKELRRAHERESPDFTGADLSDSDLRGVDLSGCCFVRATLENAWLSKAKLSKTQFDEARLSRCDLGHLHEVKDASFRGARILDCALDGSIFQGCWFNGANLAGCSTVRSNRKVPEALGCQQVNTHFLDCDFLSADLSNCILTGADFSDSNLVRASLRGSDLRDARLGAKSARWADFEGAILGLEDSGIDPATLENLDAESASFRDAELYGCNLTGATLTRSRLDNANVACAVVTDCSFEGASLVGVVGFDKVEGLMESTKAPNFSYAYIQATQAFGIGKDKVQWNHFRDWINRERDLERKRLSWVAWKNNFESLGLYAEQSECFTEEQIARSWGQLRRPPGIFQALLLALLSSVALVGLGCAYHSLAGVNGLGDKVAFWIGIGGAVALAFLGYVLWLWKKDLVRRCGLVLIDVLYGFGEQPAKILLNAIFLILAFSAMHFVAVEQGWGSFNEGLLEGPLKTPGEYVYFSMVTFTTLGYGDIQPLGFCRFLAGCEALLGLVMAALFIHALARRTAGR